MPAVALSPKAHAQQYGAMSYTYDALKDGYTSLWSGLAVLRPTQAQKEAQAIINAKERLTAIEGRTGVPWFVIGIILVREAGLRGGQLDFGACLHNGQRIIGKGTKTTIVPKNCGPFATFEDSAYDALKEYRGKAWSPEFIAFTLEKFNGFGYRNHGIPSPYLVGGSNKQKRGKYVADGEYDATVMDPQTGGLTLLKQTMAMDADASFDRGAKAATDVAEQSLPSSTINQGAATGMVGTIMYLASEAWDRVSTASETVQHAIFQMVSTPRFWFIFLAVAACAFVIYRRKALRDQLVTTTGYTPKDAPNVVEPPVMDTCPTQTSARRAKPRRKAKRRGRAKDSNKGRVAATTVANNGGSGGATATPTSAATGTQGNQGVGVSGGAGSGTA